MQQMQRGRSLWPTLWPLAHSVPFRCRAMAVSAQHVMLHLCALHATRCRPADSPSRTPNPSPTSGEYCEDQSTEATRGAHASHTRRTRGAHAAHTRPYRSPLFARNRFLCVAPNRTPTAARAGPVPVGCAAAAGTSRARRWTTRARSARSARATSAARAWRATSTRPSSGERFPLTADGPKAAASQHASRRV
jgi:hypothetical protein